jgi:DNA invertase Pin-like site-specific DNA recombinase
MSGMTFELDTPHVRMMATMLTGVAQFERDLLSERVKSGLATAGALGKKLGRQPGRRPKSESSTAPPSRPRPPEGCAAMPESSLWWTAPTVSR